MSLEFHTPSSGDWLVILDTQTGEEVYSGHGSGDQMWAVMEHCGISYDCTEHNEEEYEEKFT